MDTRKLVQIQLFIELIQIIKGIKYNYDIRTQM